MLQFFGSLNQLRLDIVGIVAVLGEGCTSRTLQVSALSWPHIFPRLLPAPQALLRHEQESRLPVQDGIVIGAYSGNTKHELNFFCQLLHHKPLEPYQVELLDVKAKTETPRSDGQAFGVRPFGWLAWLSGLGCVMAFGLIAMSIYCGDGFALVATLALAATSSIVGVASWWNLEFQEEKPQSERKDVIPDSDVIISYPNGSFRIVRCAEPIARLYFRREICKPIANDNVYRLAALLASVLLMGGLLCMGNAEPYLQIAFAGSYILLNVFHWAVSAVNPLRHHWEINYACKPIPFNPPLKKKKQSNDDRNSPVMTDPHKSEVNTDGAHDTNINGKSKTSPSSHTRQSSTQEFASLSEVGLKRRRTGTVTFELDRVSKDKTLSPLRRKSTDLEGNKKRPIIQPRAYSVPFKQTLNLIRRSSSFLTGTQVPQQTDEDRVFTSALWQVIALTGTGRWLKYTHIAPNTDVWEKWIEIATSRAIPREVRIKNQQGEVERTKNNKNEHVAPATSKCASTGAIDLPLWDYQGELNRLFKEEKDVPIKGRPPVPETSPEADISKLSEDIKTRLRQLALIARERAKARPVIKAFINPLLMRKNPVTVSIKRI